MPTASNAVKVSGTGSWFYSKDNPNAFCWRSNKNPYPIGIKQSGISGQRDNGKGDRWFSDGAAKHGSKSNARKMASALIAKIPFPLAQHIARIYKP